MQSTEEYLDQLLASVSEDDSGQKSTQNKDSVSVKSIEELDESELTEEVLQKQLALLLGLETEDDSVDSVDLLADAIMDIPEEEPDAGAVPFMQPEPVTEVLAEEPLTLPEAEIPVVEETAPAPKVSESGVLSADEIAALFASMGTEDASDSIEETQEELISAWMEEGVEPEVIAEKTLIEEAEKTSTPMSETGILSADEIAALFASMGAEETIDNTEEAEDELISALIEEHTSGQAEDSGTLTREELEELGLGDIADVLVSGGADAGNAEMTSADNSILDNEKTASADNDASNDEKMTLADGSVAKDDKVEMLDFDFDGEMLLDIENVDAMLEATAKLAEEQQDDFAADRQAEDDIMSMLMQFEEESIQENIVNEEESARVAQLAVEQALQEEEDTTEDASELSETSETGKRKKEKKPKVKKEKVKKEKVKKGSIKDKLLAFMFEDENLDEAGDEIPEDGLITATEDLSEDKPVKAKKEKSSKKEKKAKKNAKAGKEQDENAAIEAELAEEDKKKARKKEKPAKEKKAKKVVIKEKNPAEIAAEKREARRSIGTKGIIATLLVCASLLGLILVGAYILPGQLSLIAARTAFYAQDYEETAMRLMGKDLNESDRIMYEKATLLFGLEERYHQYEIYIDRGMEKEALNCLLQGVIACNKEEILAGQLGIETEWMLAKQKFITTLQEQYALDSEAVEKICELKNPDYTVAVENILAGRSYDDMSAYGGTATYPVAEEGNGEDVVLQETIADETMTEDFNPNEMEDLLPEEEAILEQLRQENVQEPIVETDSSEENNEIYSGSVEDGAVNFVE